MPKVASKKTQALPTEFDALVRLSPPRFVHDEVEYENMQEMIDALLSIPRRSKGQSEYLETITILFADYEDKHHAIETDDLTPVDTLKFLMEQNDMNASDLGRLLGNRSLGPKILNGDRELSKSHIRNLAERFSISAAVFI